MSTQLLDHAAELIRSGTPEDARKILEPMIQADPHNIRAWLLELETWRDLEGQRKLLKACLRFNPGEPVILQALAGLDNPQTVEQAGSQLPAQPFISSSTPSDSPLPIPTASPRPPQRHGVTAIMLGLLTVAALAALVGMIYILVMQCDIPAGPLGCTRVLFIGNSYTFVNDLPSTFASLARSGGRPVQVEMVATGGWTLAQHAASQDTLAKISQHGWNYVVLQEQSEVPAVEQSRLGSMYPASRLLVSQIARSGAMPLFYLTWGHQDGYPQVGMRDYASMQAQLTSGYMRIAGELVAPVAPVGPAWQMALIERIGADLWQADGSHPTPAGTYLAACVFYATIFERSPEGLRYTGGLPPDVAARLQSVAASVVLQNPHTWNLP